MMRNEQEAPLSALSPSRRHPRLQIIGREIAVAVKLCLDEIDHAV